MSENENRLWAPWRLDYVTGGDKSKPEAAALPEPAAWRKAADRGCFLCRAAAIYDSPPAIDRQLLVVHRGVHTLSVLNRYPYNNGHVLVAPLRHAGELETLTSDEHLECIGELQRLIGIMRPCMNADGFNIGLNLGHVAGAGVPGHLHWHLVPRWKGDQNFMPVVAATRVIPQSLEALWDMLTKEMATK
jgi:ATP adenylyltransferase